MQIKAIINSLEQWAPLQFQESYDNSGLIVGDPEANCTGVLCSLDCTEAVIEEAIQKGCNLIVSHHPIIFKGIKQFSGDPFPGLPPSPGSAPPRPRPMPASLRLIIFVCLFVVF
jgi:putative NIF3 family GTP cyclohydrolase 1 type 2